MYFEGSATPYNLLICQPRRHGGNLFPEHHHRTAGCLPRPWLQAGWSPALGSIALGSVQPSPASGNRASRCGFRGPCVSGTAGIGAWATFVSHQGDRATHSATVRVARPLPPPPCLIRSWAAGTYYPGMSTAELNLHHRTAPLPPQPPPGRPCPVGSCA
jgi:hypothetical protein